jgi:choline dehydrogenase-like flavoprotein
VAALLTKLGQKVLVLEAGPNYFPGIDQPAIDAIVPLVSNDHVKVMERTLLGPDPLVEPRTFRTQPSDGDRTFVGSVNVNPKTVGGGSIHASLAMPRFTPADFTLGTALGSVPGASFADWPVTYTTLEPFYLYVENAMGVQGQAGADPFAGPRSGAYPMPPGPSMYVAELVRAGTKKLGYTLFPMPQAVNSMPYDGRPACVSCGFCGSMACPTHAKGAPAMTMVRKALLSGKCQLLTETRAARLTYSGSNVTGVEAILPDGTRQTFTANRYVLAASPIEDVRLLLLSDPGGPGLGNSSGLVGRNLMFHYFTTAIGIFEQRLHGHRGRTCVAAFSDFRGVPGDPNHPLGGVVGVSGIEPPIAEALGYVSILKPLGQSAALKKWMRQSPARDRMIALTMYGEDAPQPTNTVDLDPAVRDLDGVPVARITYQNHNYELSTQTFYAPKLLDLLGAAGARYATIEPAGAVPSTNHIMGTLRFGTDPTASVCDPTGRFHDVGNLYAADGSLFPTSAGYNPTLTIATLATYVAAEMVFPGAPQKALS